ncbi:mitochondrial distribution and morphology family 35/apoptosis protein [Theileria orientalis strain Shintoku]|uniref:Mitochondrial distribution and morphology family 35/apoptosis protein n=1 Tax=Theileria orientalis strain Shintoku TaxID=869250 RepID=J4CD32_THEOR|nr:mitochondrial distribution and morphology family 35/apoptosis protein [Theileria orientalis strain Shintoku]BAM40437.1 mitochondrial distribution and morphology family 35/apoptosis protein [Theileria orientalis strain Shintoku]|eukprot:XP_009690738.1 mitochondrial distribution and morphology family 35/apoptosis protein [Theileria orientalis strain Shintoku]
MGSREKESGDSTSKSGENCKHLKDLYDQCFNNWFKHDFLKGNFNDKCKLKLKDYRACLVEFFEKKGNQKLVDMIKKFD